jgi:hypothetical protein
MCMERVADLQLASCRAQERHLRYKCIRITSALFLLTPRPWPDDVFLPG